MKTIPVDINNLVAITLADGVERHLRYSLGAKKRICEKFGSENLKLLGAPAEELIPFVLNEGLVERDGITEDAIMEKLVTSNMTDYVLLQFIESFFVPQVAQNLKRVLSAVSESSERALKALETKSSSAQPPEVPQPTVQ